MGKCTKSSGYLDAGISSIARRAIHRWATAVSRMLPGSPFIVRALFALRTGEKIMPQSRPAVGIPGVFEFLRASTLAASRVNLPSSRVQS